jgi:tRNA (mo5U34)-methyltransferase
MEYEEKEKIVSAHEGWYHRIEIAPGLVTPGISDSALALANLDEIGLPRECRGMDVLDVGCSDGFFSFEMERRGAHVRAIDYVLPSTSGFSIAKKLLGSNVDCQVLNVYELSPEEHGTFDIVLFLGVLYHLRNPLLALDRIRRVTRPGGSLLIETQLIDNYFLLGDGSVTELASLSPLLPTIPLLQFYPGDALCGEATNKWAPNMTCLQRMVEEAQFEVGRSKIFGARGYVACRAIRDSTKEHYTRVDYGKGH